MEKQVKPGVYISAITKAKWHERVEALSGDDRAFFIEQCNPFRVYSSVFIDVTGMSRTELLELCLELESDFNPETDFIVIRYAPDLKPDQASP